NAFSVLNLARNIQMLDCGGMEGLCDRMGQAMGVSGAEFASVFQYDAGWFYADAMNSILCRVTDIGLEETCEYLGQMSKIYTSDRMFEQLAYSPMILADVLSAMQSMGGLDELVNSLCQTYSYSDVVYAMQDMGMASLSRVNTDDLPELISNRINSQDDGRPLAVVIYPSADYNGAFMSGSGSVHQLIEHGYRVMYYEADTDTEIEVCLVNGTQNGAVPAAVLIVGGHGSQQSLSLGCSEGEECLVDFSDYGQLSGLRDMLADGGTIILYSCSNGQGLNEQANMANMWAQLFPNAAHVFSMTEPSNIESLTFSSDNKVTDVTFGCDTYDAALYDTDFSFTFNGIDEEELYLKIEIGYQEIKD
ncbi:MAG TPA: hypothetical protein PLJ26_07135, partial [Candidatus Omnitrophota bacterium]|nr:hypothetical protein [Candidatus Omnitrophota bacterium]